MTKVDCMKQVNRCLKDYLCGSQTLKKNKPIVFYHATRADSFDVFKTDKNGCIFFSTSPEIALSFTNLSYYYKNADGSEHIYPVYLYAKKIFDTLNPDCIEDIEPYLKKNLEIIIYSFLRKQLVEHYPTLYISIMEHVKKEDYRLTLIEELRNEKRVMPDSLELFESFFLKGKEYTLKLLKQQISSEIGWIFFEKVHPDLITHIQNLNYDSFVTIENVRSKFNFNIAVFSPNQIKSLYNFGFFDKKSDSIMY